jgi:hypothetical protein
MKHPAVNHVLGPQPYALARKSSEASPVFRGGTATLIACLFALILVTGCASTQVTDQQRFYSGSLPQPGNILVYDFAATPAEVPADSALAGQDSAPETSRTYDQIKAGREVGALIAVHLAEDIRALGMPAERALTVTQPQINDLVIRGCLISVNEGSAAKRLTIGFGAGGSELKVAVECYQMTAQGLRKLGTGDVQGSGSKGPGGAVGLAALIATGNPVGLIVSSGTKVYGEASGRSKLEGRAKQIAKEIASRLKVRFQEQCWID